MVVSTAGSTAACWVEQTADERVVKRVALKVVQMADMRAAKRAVL